MQKKTNKKDVPRGYPVEVREYINLRLETCNSVNAIAREVKVKFEVPQDTEIVRKYITKTKGKILKKAGPNGALKQKDLKILIFDIETSPFYYPTFRLGEQYLSPCDYIMGEVKIICISYKWVGEDVVHTLTWDKNQNEKKMLEKFIRLMAQANEIVGHNIDRFDIKHLRTRCLMNSVLMYTKYRTFDTLKKFRHSFTFLSNKLDYLSKKLEVGKKNEHEGKGLWIKVCYDTDPKVREESLKEMVAYCEQDVVLNEDVYSLIKPYVSHNTNHAVANHGHKWQCPSCASKDVQHHHTDTTAMGYIKRHMRCNHCKTSYHVSNRTYGDFLQTMYQNGK